MPRTFCLIFMLTLASRRLKTVTRYIKTKLCIVLVATHMSNVASRFKPAVKSLCVTLDSCLRFSTHIGPVLFNQLFAFAPLS